MTSQKRLLIKFQDLTWLRMTCHHCQASVNIPLFGERKPLPAHCPSCENLWFLEDGSDGRQISQLVDIVRHLKERSANARCAVELEIDQPE